MMQSHRPGAGKEKRRLQHCDGFKMFQVSSKDGVLFSFAVFVFGFRKLEPF